MSFWKRNLSNNCTVETVLKESKLFVCPKCGEPKMKNRKSTMCRDCARKLANIEWRKRMAKRASQKHSQLYSQKGRVQRQEIRTVIVEDGNVVFVEVPEYRLPTLQQLGPTTFSIRLYPLE